MNSLFKAAKVLLLVFFCFIATSSYTQSILNPSDAVVTYNAASPPATPAWGTIAKWVRTKRLSWNTDSYKAYYYNGFAFRLKFPKTYDPAASDGKKYPMIIFFHGLGEKGTVYDNEFSMYHGGQQFRDKVDNGTFDGYVFIMQTTNGYWDNNSYNAIRGIIDYMVTNNKLDLFHIVTNGLSAGGSGTWEMLINNPTYISAALPMSACDISYRNSTIVQPLKYTPIWIFQGGLDGAPDPYTTEQVRDAFNTAGGNFKYTLYPTLGHGTWNTAWAETDFYPFVNRVYKSNPWTLFGRTEFCSGDAVNVTLGLTSGFDQYEWRRNGVLISGAASNTLNVTGTAITGNPALGIYTARIRKGSVWSDWSPAPVEIKIKAPTIPPTISVQGLSSKHLPALDGSASVTLTVPTGYQSYVWQKEGSSTTLSTTNTVNATTAGNYKVSVLEQYGCSSEFSAPFAVVDANGPNKPDAPSNLLAAPLSKTSIRLDWSQTLTPNYNETGFEVYQSTTAGGPYTLVAITAADVTTYTINSLQAKTKYYYILRAVNNTGASSATSEANATTDADAQAPTAPSNLTITGTTRSSISLSWTASTDEVGIDQYQIYVNGALAYLTNATTFTVNNLQFGTSYNIYVKAKDISGNLSVQSNQVTGQALATGLPYTYYTFTGSWTVLPNYRTLVPVTRSVMANIAITPRTQNDNFAFLWEGFITVPVSGTYYFRTRSDAGSRIWLGALNGKESPYTGSATNLIVDNDGIHSAQDRTSNALSLTAGTYPIAIAYFEQTGSESMAVTWRTPQTGFSYVSIPNSAFVDVAATGAAVASPSQLTATAVSYKQINLSWVDNSNNETGFEIYRSTNETTGFITIGVAAANATSYADSASLNPSVRYYYRIRAIGQTGESAIVSNVNPAEAIWKLDNVYTDASGNGRTLTQTNTPVFNSSDKKEGTHSLGFNGSSQYVTPPASSSFLQNAYSQKTVAFWMKSSDNTGNRVIVDIGGSDDGLALRLDASRLYAGVASNNTRYNISTAYTSTGWNHIALVYNGNTLRLYVNGVEAASNTSMAFTSITTTSNGSRIGTVNSSNAFNTGTGYFSGLLDDINIYAAALSSADIVNLMNNTAVSQSYATTTGLPSVPAAPANLLATGVSNTVVNVTWNDVADETGYQVYRSFGNNTSYIQYASLPANTIAFTDSALFPNTIYYYEVRAVNVGGNSGFSNEDSAKTANSIPVIISVGNKAMRFGTTLQVNVSATDADGETLTVTPSNLPAFATFVPSGNGSGTITFNPAETDQGTYPNITLSVSDISGGSSSTSFSLTVNDNYAPQIGAVANATVDEMQAGQVNISATDQNAADVLTWSFTGLPSFAAPVINGNNVQFNLAPGYADQGTYNVTASVSDGNGGADSKSFIITVNNIDPNKRIFINFTDGSYTSPAPWNNTTKNPAFGDNYAALKDHTGATTTIGFNVTSYWEGIPAGTNTGVNTGNNSGVYPDNVMRSFWFTNAAVQTIRVYGLNPSIKYNFTFFGSRCCVSDDRTSVYTINSTSASLQAANNSQNTVSLNNLVPDAAGELTLTISKSAAAQFGYLNAMVIESIYDDGLPPAKPRDIAASFNNSKVDLSWIDAAYNEQSYEVYRSVGDRTGVYTLLNPGGNNAGLQQYQDGNVSGNKTYYYYVIARNTAGASLSSDTVSVSTPNTAPILASIADVKMKTDQVVNVTVSSTDDPGDIITLQVTGLPSFATFTDNGNGTGTISLQPGSTMGAFSGITVIATDNSGAASNTQFSVTVTDKNITKYYVNFNGSSITAGNPWNSFNTEPYPAGTSLSNIKDETGGNSSIGVTLVDVWTASNTLGATTGNNTGVYPDNVMQTFYYTDQSTVRRIRITGLSTSATARYNLIFFASRGGVADDRSTVYSYGGQSVSLNAASNTTNTVQLNGLVPNAAGEIEFTAQKASTSPYGYINALVIQSYVDDGMPLAPANLGAAGNNTSIGLNWSDRSNNETGFEVYRSSSLNGTYSLLTTTAANVTSYTDATVAAGTLYYYKVRAVKTGAPTVYSDYTNTAAASTILYVVDLNFNDGVSNPAQGGNWTNTNQILQIGSTVNNFINRAGQYTGMNLTLLTEFTGYNIYGKTTGNNTGIYPDNVMAGFFYVNYGDTAKWKIDGLNLAGNYNFKFFGSRLSPTGGPVTTSYKIGNKVVTLDATDNTTNVATISGVVPDSTGTVYITMYTTEGRGYVNAMTIEGALNDRNIQNGGSGSGISSSMVAGRVGAFRPPASIGAGTVNNRATEQPVIKNLKVGAYPNPFTDDVTLNFEMTEMKERVVVYMTDLMGRRIYSREFRNVPQGVSQFKLGIEGNNYAPGIYIINVEGSKATFKLIKK
ncbi:MAG: fibronectin type III domain-containing protein [Lacibacter sp.]